MTGTEAKQSDRLEFGAAWCPTFDIGEISFGHGLLPVWQN